MTDKTQDIGANWREKYLDALDQQEQQEKALLAQQELLRRALVRVSVSADGQDEALDTILGQLRERMRGAINGDINSLLVRLDDVALNFEQHRDKNAQEVRQSLIDTVKPLQDLDLSRAVKKEINQYLAQLPQRSEKVRLYPALLKQLATIQQHALQEIAQPKTGFLQKLLGAKEPQTGKEPSAEKILLEKELPAEIAKHSNLTAHTSEVQQKNTSSESLDDAVAASSFAESYSAVSTISGFPLSAVAEELSQDFVDKVTHIINQFLAGLENETPLANKVQSIRERINAGMTADVFISTLETLRDLVMQAYLLANEAFANYLKNVNRELADIYSVVGGAVETEVSMQAASQTLQHSVMKEMENLQSHVDTATDLAQLKNQVKSQIGNIRQALDHYQQAESSQQKLAKQLEALSFKIKSMEDDAEKNRSVLEQQRHRALHDPLTELPNREYYNERSNYEFQRWQRYARPLTIAIFDIDHFKKINDTYGHQAGDRVLKVIGRSIAKRLREVDFFCRFGGEEFVALMPETSLEEAMQVLDKIRAAIANAAFNYKEQSLVITLSLGATEFRAGDNLELAFARADKALYAAKEGGRNCARSA